MNSTFPSLTVCVCASFNVFRAFTNITLMCYLLISNLVAIYEQDAETICSTVYMCNAVQHKQLDAAAPVITSSVKKDGKVSG